MTGHPRDTVYPFSWREAFHESSILLIEQGWKRLTVDELPWSAELVRYTQHHIVLIMFGTLDPSSLPFSARQCTT
jgi:hypothetical protein